MAKCIFCKTLIAPDAKVCPTCHSEDPASWSKKRSGKYYFDIARGHGEKIKQQHEKANNQEIVVEIQSVQDGAGNTEYDVPWSSEQKRLQLRKKYLEKQLSSLDIGALLWIIALSFVPILIIGRILLAFLGGDIPSEVKWQYSWYVVAIVEALLIFLFMKEDKRAKYKDRQDLDEVNRHLK